MGNETLSIIGAPVSRMLLHFIRCALNGRPLPPDLIIGKNDFGDRAMSMFGSYEEMTVYLPGKNISDKKAMIAKTKETLAEAEGFSGTRESERVRGRKRRRGRPVHTVNNN